MWTLVLDLIAPRGCAACDAWLAPGALALCEACELATGPAPAAPPLLSAPRFATGAHRDGLRDAVLAWKTAPRPDLSRPLAERLVAALPPNWRSRTRTVVPIPGDRGRTRDRGFDPVARLAIHVARQLDARHRLDALAWQSPRAKQAHLGADDRLAAADSLIARPVAGPVLVVDDVSTTGATLEGAVRALRAAGVDTIATACISAMVRHTQSGTES